MDEQEIMGWIENQKILIEKFNKLSEEVKTLKEKVNVLVSKKQHEVSVGMKYLENPPKFNLSVEEDKK